MIRIFQLTLHFLSRVSLFAFVAALILFANCANKSDEIAETSTPASDEKAIEIANQVLQASGGRENWEETRYVTWRTFGKRLIVWDKLTDDVRIESRVSCILMNLNTMQGKAWKWGHEITDPHELKRAMEYGYEAWVKDSYWILLPFKLRDKGAILKYLREDEKDGYQVDVLELTFDNVGPTPNNKYHLYVDKASHNIIRWDYFMDAEDDRFRFTTPWNNYQKFGNIYLSNDRGEKKHTDLAVFKDLPHSVFDSPETVPWLKGDAGEAKQEARDSASS